MSTEQALSAEDRSLWSTGFNDALNSARTDSPNPFWANASQIVDDKPVTLEINKEFLRKHHIDRVFAQGALAGFKAWDDRQAALAKRVIDQAEVEAKRKTLKKEDPPLDDVPEVPEVSLDDAWDRTTPHLRPVPQTEEKVVPPGPTGVKG